MNVNLRNAIFEAECNIEQCQHDLSTNCDDRNSPAKDEIEPPEILNKNALTTSENLRLDNCCTNHIGCRTQSPPARLAVNCRSHQPLNSSLSALTLANDSHPLMFNDADNEDDSDETTNRNLTNCEHIFKHADNHLLGHRATNGKHRAYNAVCAPMTDCWSIDGGARPKAAHVCVTHQPNNDNEFPEVYETCKSVDHQSVSMLPANDYLLPLDAGILARSRLRRISIDAAALSDNDDDDVCDASSIDSASPQHSFGDQLHGADLDEPTIMSPEMRSVSITSSMLQDDVTGGAAAKAADHRHGNWSLIPQYLAVDEARDARHWRRVTLPNGQNREIDMRVIDPFKRVLSHGGYLSAGGRNAIVVFSACHLPDKSRRDYHYVMNNLFLYVVETLEQLVTDDYVLVYMHGGASRHNAPQFTWLKSCYQLLDRRLRKSLRNMYIVHPSLWLKSMVVLLRPFTSRKFWKKVIYVKSLEELYTMLPLEKAAVSEKVRRFDEKYA